MSVRVPTIKKTQHAERQWPPPRGQWTYEDWVKLPDDGWRYEVIEGVLHMTPAPKPKHQRVLSNLNDAVKSFVHERALGEVFFTPIDVMLPGQETPVEPDLVYIPAEQADMVGEDDIEGVPPLLVEVLSPSNWWVDRRTKFEFYAECGVQEYWIVDPEPAVRTIEVYQLAGGSYALMGKWGPGEVARSEVLAGFDVAVDDVFAEPGQAQE